MKVETDRIKGITTWDSGGGIELDLIELVDGRVLCVSDEAVVLYKDMDDLGATQASNVHISISEGSMARTAETALISARSSETHGSSICLK